MILSQLRRQRARALALTAGILVAATSFTLLTSTVTTSQARTTETVRANARSAYDVLVRPKGSQTEVEKTDGLVEANFLSGIFGGITLGQYGAIKKIPGVEIAAPVANVGYLMVQGKIKLDLSPFLAGGSSAQMLRIRPTLTAGPNHYQAADQYLYLSRNPIKEATAYTDTTFDGLQQEQVGHKKYPVCWYYNNNKTEYHTQLGDNSTLVPLQPTLIPEDRRNESPFDPDMNSWLTCKPGRNNAEVEIPVNYPVLLSAVDPTAENQLVGLDQAVTSGRMLSERDQPQWNRKENWSDKPYWKVPVVLSDQTLTAGTFNATVEQLDTGDPAALPAKLGSPAAHDFVNALPGTSVGHVSADLANSFPDTSLFAPLLDSYWTVGPVDYRHTEDGLTPQSLPKQSPEVWRTNRERQFVDLVPEENTGTQFRKVVSHPGTACWGTLDCPNEDYGRTPIPYLTPVGRFDAAKLPGFSTLSVVPLETYRSPQVTGADAAARKALHDKPLAPDRNLGGYLTPPPTMLTTLDSLRVLTQSRRQPTVQDKAPVSAIRIRVAGVTGVDPASQARVNAVAGRIRTTYPGLQVDITVGSSPAPQTIALPSVKVQEYWTAKGVALRILKAVDTKSAVLFVLVLVVCGLFLAQAALASVRSRRTEIGTLRCMGWTASEVLRLVLGELAVIGLAAGAAGAVLAFVLGWALDLPHAALKAAAVLPVALLLALAAGVVPAWRATRLRPLDAIRPPVVATGRAAPVRTVLGLSVRNLLRVPGRTVLGAAGLALGVAAFTVLLALTLAFRGEVAGSLLGNAVVAQARTADYLSVALSLLLGAAGAVDVLVLSQRERAADLAVLRATGWTGAELARLTAYEGVLLALLGSLTGALAGLGLVLGIGRGVLHGHLLAVGGAALLATAAAVVLVSAALAFPIRAHSRIAPAHLLAAD
ncbi:FtsX-like permease family protein [Streptacidiphilus griseoplanus]|uniref:FtsX-like permease family protein n=1 Tax=Peterkaempfera griseoplana TaxID=66896 RepID=UPI0006E1FA46|nr:FtsX-like permease family protein [Peterkaempfera griseoplana]